jgi:hypothetical protein
VFFYRAVESMPGAPVGDGPPTIVIRPRDTRQEEQQLRAEIEQLRRQIDDIKAYLKKSAEENGGR